MDNENKVRVILLSKKIEDLNYLTEQLNIFLKTIWLWLTRSI